MRALQWSAIPLGIGLLLCIAAHPFTHYAVIVDLGQPVVAEEGKPIGEFKRWKNGFLFIREIGRLNNYQLTTVPKGLTSGPHPHAKPNWLVNIGLTCCIVVVCGFIFGWRPKGDRSKKEAMAESLAGFAALGVAFMLGCTMVIYGFSWKPSGLAILSALGGLFLLWASAPSGSRGTDSKPTE